MRAVSSRGVSINPVIQISVRDNQSIQFQLLHSVLCLPTSEEVSVLGVGVARLRAGAHARCHRSLALILDVLGGYLHLCGPCELPLATTHSVVVVMIMVMLHFLLAIGGSTTAVQVADGGGVR